MKFWKLLNKTEVKHLHEYGIHNVASFKHLREYQVKRDAKSRAQGYVGSIATSCYECNSIAAKVGLEGT